MRISLLTVLVTLATASLGAPADADQRVFQHVTLGPAGGNAQLNVDENEYAMSADGAHVFFQTREGLTADDTDGMLDIYRRTGDALQRVTTGPNGGNGPYSATMGVHQRFFDGGITRQLVSSVSDDGSVVVFSTAESLVPADTDSTPDLYKWSNGSTSVVTGGPGGGFAGMSSDGSRVFFESGGHHVAGDEETAICTVGRPGRFDYREYPCIDVFEHHEGQVRLISSGPSDARGPVDHELADYSADGSVVVFESTVSLVPEDTDTQTGFTGTDVYRWRDGDITLVTDEQRDEYDEFMYMSQDGERVIFYNAPNLWEWSEGVIRQRTPSGEAGLVGASADAEHIFWETASALVGEDTDSCADSSTGGCSDVYMHSYETGTRLVSKGPSMGNVHTGRFYEVSRDGRKAYFLTGDTLVPADLDTSYDIYEYDIATDTTKLISTGPTDTETKNPWYAGASADGSRVYFYTEARMTTEDRDTLGDIYERAGSTTTLVTNSPGLRDGIFGFMSWYEDLGVYVSPDGSRLAFRTIENFLPSDTDNAYYDIFAIVPPDLTAYPRPRAAFTVQVPLVQAARPCTSPNMTHGPPLAFPSCNPPLPQSNYLTTGSGGTSGFPADSVGQVRLDLLPGASGGADDTDVAMRVHLTNVWWQAGTRVDYDGELQARLLLRATDRDDAVPSTVQDRTIAFVVPCTTTPDEDMAGSTCSAVTTADAVLPGLAPERERTLWEVGQVQVTDGGSDGQISSFGDNRVFAVQGLFVP